MQLDNTRIAVRERSLLDTFDLSLHVLRSHCGPLSIAFFAGAVPLMIVNHILLGWMIRGDRESFFYLEDADVIARFLSEMSLLVAIEAPLASVWATAYLGQALFVRQPRLWQIGSDVIRMLPRLAWCQLLVRGVLPTWLLLAALERSGGFNPSLEILGLGGLACYALGLRFLRPFINEIVLLERNPLIATGRSAMTVGRRSNQLHGPSGGDLFFRGLSTAMLGGLLTLSVCGTFVFFSGVFLNDWQPGPWMIGMIFPLSMWLVAGYLTVVRFLNYLDLRIRHEGWEVELGLRAEGERLTSQLR